MPSSYRTSRADRRRGAPPETHAQDRRTSIDPTDFKAHSQVKQNELQVFVKSTMTAANCAASREGLKEHTSRSPEKLVALDLEHCPYMDTPGLSVVFELKKALEAEGRGLILQNPSRAVQRILNITQMFRVFTVRMCSSDLEKIPAAAPVSKSE